MCHQSVGCLQYFGSKVFGPAKRSSPRSLSTVPLQVTITVPVSYKYSLIKQFIYASYFLIKCCYYHLQITFFLQNINPLSFTWMWSRIHRYRMWLLAASRWLLVASCWPLAAGYCIILTTVGAVGVLICVNCIYVFKF